MSPSPSDRVTAFIADYADQVAAITPAFDRTNRQGPPPFQDWRDRLAEVASRHGVVGFTLDASSFESPGAHDPQIESVVGEQVSGEVAMVSARRNKRVGYRFLEYSLQRSGDDWRISRIRDYRDDPDAPAVDPAKAADALAAPSLQAELRPLGEQDRHDPGSALGPDVVEVGRFSHSGLLAIGDFGDRLATIVPLARRVAPGMATAHIVLVDGRCGALRVSLADATPAQWRLADAVGRGYVYGVDAGNLSVIDAGRAYGLTVRDKEVAWEAFGDREAAMLAAGDEDFGVIAHSGNGDGAYPAYWGLDEVGEPVQLVVDFGLVPGAPWGR
ncbi:DUF4241 domain-containing protein [Propionibacteriaceae bacterium G1746]|uniref:DUF4241 domain-containing protein n=1 Tax=Aestuariimicrobium sp. G57 TaxID=3418485 RepID=UPI003C2A1961